MDKTIAIVLQIVLANSFAKMKILTGADYIDTRECTKSLNT